MSCFADRLKTAVQQSDSSQPDSLGDQLFRTHLEYCHHRNTSTMTRDFLVAASQVLNGYLRTTHERRVEATGLTHLRCQQYVVA